jgi:hypothetical protein
MRGGVHAVSLCAALLASAHAFADGAPEDVCDITVDTRMSAAPAKPCKLELVTAGAYAVVRDGVNFDPYAKLRTREAAREYARGLERAKLCKPMR